MSRSIQRGRLIDHLHLMVADFAASRRFYGAVLEALEIEIQGDGEDHFFCDELFVSTPEHTGGDMLTGRHHLAFIAKSEAMVQRFFELATQNGGSPLGEPGIRAKYSPTYYAAFVLDPDGNNIEAVFHGPASQNVESVVVSLP